MDSPDSRHAFSGPDARRLKATTGGALLLALTAALLLIGAGRSAAWTPQARTQQWAEPLEALHPADAMSYFELAEEVADVATDDDQRALARTLFALAGVLDPHRLGRSAALALADLESDAHAVRRLRALAGLLGASGIGPAAPADPLGPLTGEHDSGAVVALMETFSEYRRGRGAQAMDALREPGAMELLEEIGPHLSGGVTRFLEDIRMYRGQLRPSLSQEALTKMLRLELALLSGADRPWSSELMLRRGEPLVEVDPERLDEAFGVDASRPLYRAGRWVAVERE